MTRCKVSAWTRMLKIIAAQVIEIAASRPLN